MGYHARISEAFSGATGLPLTRQSKYILFSDCHRGTGKANDNFLKNEFLFVAALKHYYHNGFLWRLTRFLVRYLWKNLELLGVPDPTSSAKNYTQKEKTEKRLAEWAKQNNHILIAGHTHRPMLGSRQSPYFNTGSCVHPMSITGIEIEKRCITLVKWSLGTGPEQVVYVIREPLGETVCIDDYV